MQSTVGKRDVQLSPQAIFGFDTTMFSPPMGFTHHPDIGASITEMIKHLQTAVSLELSTIPLYLYAAYSIVEPGPATRSILAVVQQEMLHVALAGNILCSIGGKPILYYDNSTNAGMHSYFPEYPANMIYQDITLSMKAATKSNFRTFMELERPEPELELDNILPNSDGYIYGSIGAFYSAIELELVRINTSSSKSPFVADPDRQYKHGDGSWYDRNMVAVTNIESAKAAIQTIVEQGEGSTKAPRPPTEFKRERVVEPTPPLAVRSHYEVFEELYRGTPLSCHKLLENPKTKDLSDNETFYPILRFGDSAYCYLLITIEKVWEEGLTAEYRRDLVTNNLQNIMLYILRPLAAFLVGQTYVDKKGIEWKLAPFFNFFQFEEGEEPSRLEQLKKSCEEAVKKAAELQSLQSVIDGLIAV